MQLDSIDWQLLYELDYDASQSLESLAKKAKTSKDVIYYRINKLEKQGIILRYDTMIDYSKAGYLLGGASIKFKNEESEDRNNVAEYLISEPLIRSLYWRNGDYDLDIGWYAKDVPEFTEAKKTLLKKHAHVIKDFEDRLISTLLLYSRNYLFSNEKSMLFAFVDFSPDKKTQGHDNYILSMIANDSTIPYSVIANELKISNAQVHRRIKRMEKEKIILGSRAILDVEKLGYHRYKLQIHFDDFKVYDDLLSYVASLPNAVSASEALGGADLQISFETRSYNEFKKIELAVKEKFGKAIYYTEDYKVTGSVLKSS